MGVGVVGLAENKANSAQLELEAGAELGNTFEKPTLGMPRIILKQKTDPLRIKQD